MIRVRRSDRESPEELTLEEFEQRVRLGEIGPGHEVSFALITGSRFVAARDLDLFRRLYDSRPIAFRAYFNLGRPPVVTAALIALLVLVYVFWQDGAPSTQNTLLRFGAKSPALMVELGQWWRLLVANVLHVSVWHLVVNCFFLFNLGGPTEAVFRRLDYVLVLVASALGTTLVSAAANPGVSCGASGVVFGVWGAAAVFGIRHRHMLPERYRRYFIFGVIPYSVFALYLGFAMPGVDNWGHLGGLVAGSLTSLGLPARLMVPTDRWVPVKLATLSVVALVLAAGSAVPLGVGALSEERYYAYSGLQLPVPERWRALLSRRDSHGQEAYVFGNGADVGVGLKLTRSASRVDPETMVQDFVARELDEERAAAGPAGLEVSAASDVPGFPFPTKHVRTVMRGQRATSRTEHYIVARGHYRYVVSFTSPAWMQGAYDPAFAQMLAGARFVEPREVSEARRTMSGRSSPSTVLALWTALASAGAWDEAKQVLAEGLATFPESKELGELRVYLE